MPRRCEQALPGAAAPPRGCDVQVQRPVLLGQVPRRGEQALPGQLIARCKPAGSEDAAGGPAPFVDVARTPAQTQDAQNSSSVCWSPWYCQNTVAPPSFTVQTCTCGDDQSRPPPRALSVHRTTTRSSSANTPSIRIRNVPSDSSMKRWKNPSTSACPR